LGLLKDFFREVEAFDYQCEAFIKTTRLFEEIYSKMEALIRSLRLFQRFGSDVRLFQRIRGFFKLFPNKWKFVHKCRIF
jgi:hypothetical protein